MNAKRSTQLSLFPQGEDLPLFTGTAPQAEVQPYQKDTTPRPNPLPFDCRFCRDTGRLGGYAFCSCKTGVEARNLKIKERVIEAAKNLPLDDIRDLTSYDDPETVQRIYKSFVSYCFGTDTRYPQPFPTWQAAWEAFWPEMKEVLESETPEILGLARKRDEMIRDAAALSSGTIATLTGYRDYKSIEKIQNTFVIWVTQFYDYPHWKAAWDDFTRSDAFPF